MTSHAVTQSKHAVYPATLARYHHVIRAAAELVSRRRPPPGEGEFAFEAPEPDVKLREFYATSEISVHMMDSLGGRPVTGLNLMRNPGTRTTKTLASLSMVARAARHIADTGERVIIVTPTSGNKGTALRDAVARAHATGLASPDQLRVVTVTPAESARKLRDSPLAADADLRAANPVVLAAVDQPARVKEIARAVVDAFLTDPASRGWRVWYTLDLDNYRIADVVRACVDAEFAAANGGTDTDRPRWHAHAVSSAYGLLGYSLGHGLLSAGAAPELRPHPAHPSFFLVQHLATPDMVLSLTGGKLPTYVPDPGGGWRQDTDPRFPTVTDSPTDRIDPTFYTRAPVTSAEIDPLIGRHGGGGVVVSRRECLERYDRVREFAAPLDVPLPADPDDLREWSLVMALTGLLVADERGLLPPDSDIVVHASGSYFDETLPPADPGHVRHAADESDVLEALRTAVA